MHGEYTDIVAGKSNHVDHVELSIRFANMAWNVDIHKDDIEHAIGELLSAKYRLELAGIQNALTRAWATLSELQRNMAQHGAREADEDWQLAVTLADTLDAARTGLREALEPR
jgi:hypothetical protein